MLKHTIRTNNSLENVTNYDKHVRQCNVHVTAKAMQLKEDTANVTVAGTGYTTSSIKSQADINFSEPFRCNNTHESGHILSFQATIYAVRKDRIWLSR